MHPWHGKTWEERKAKTAEFREWYRNNPGLRLSAGQPRGDGKVFANYNVNSKDGERWQSASSRKAGIERMGRWHYQNREKVLVGRKKQYAENEQVRAVVREKNKQWAIKNPERYAQAVKKWRVINPEKWAEHQIRWRERNIEKIREKGRRWCKENPEKKNAMTARRWAAKKRQLHPDHDTDAELRLRAEAKSLFVKTGIVHHVDHIIPLAFGGWHHHDNLQVLTIAENLKKNDDPFYELPGRKTWRDVPRHLWPESLSEEYAKRAA
jgi:hypothetical protein